MSCGDALVMFTEVLAPQIKDKRVVVNKEQLNDAVMSSPTGNSEVHVEMAPVTSASQKQTFLKDGEIDILLLNSGNVYLFQ